VRLQAPAPPGDDTLALPAESPAFPIHRIHLELPPEHAATFRFASAYLERYQGRDLGPEGLKLIMARLTRRLLDRGFTTTRVDLPAQNLSGGTLTLRLIPGVISAIRATGPDTWRAALPCRPGDLLNLRDLEQGLEQFKRVPSQDVTMAIAPGARPGESELLLTFTRGRPWRGALTLDDSGLPATGPWQGHLQAAWDNPLGRSDQLTASLSHDLTAWRQGSGTRGASLAYTLPAGYWTFGATWQRYEYAQRLSGLYRDLDATGWSSTLELRAARLFHRDQTQKNTLQLRLGQRTGKAFLEAVELDVQRRANSFAELALIHTRALGRAQLDVTLAHRQGLSWFGAQADLGPTGPTFFYRLRTLDATLGLPLGGLRYTATLHAQHTRDTLFATEYLSLGGRHTVRGFPGDGAVASENGLFLRNDLERPLGRATSLYLGLDAGRVYGANERALPGRALVGAVLGVKGVLHRRLSFNAFLGGPLHRPSALRPSWPVLGLTASLHF